MSEVYRNSGPGLLPLRGLLLDDDDDESSKHLEENEFTGHIDVMAVDSANWPTDPNTDFPKHDISWSGQKPGDYRRGQPRPPNPHWIQGKPRTTSVGTFRAAPMPPKQPRSQLSKESSRCALRNVGLIDPLNSHPDPNPI